MIATYRYRVKDKHASRLNAQARAVNTTWNYCNEVQQRAAKSRRPWLSAFDLMRLTAGATKEGLDINAESVNEVCRYYVQSRKKKPWLRWRSRHSLGWLPIKPTSLRHADGAFWYRRERYDIWLSRPLPEGAEIKASSFSQDARGRWYINVTVKVAADTACGRGAVGVDLGLKTLATLSDGREIAMPSYFRKAEARVGAAQRAGKKRLTLARRTKVANQRRDYLHKASTGLVKEYGLIVVGDVSPSKLARTSMAKSVLDAGWSDFRRMIAYKALTHGAIMLEVNEAYTSRTCSHCDAMSGPKGIAGLGIREWACAICGSVNDRDVNAARNILRVGLDALAGGAGKPEQATHTPDSPDQQSASP